MNLTDDVMLFAQAALVEGQFPVLPAAVVRGAVLDAACSWREVRVRAIDPTPPRARVGGGHPVRLESAHFQAP